MLLSLGIGIWRHFMQCVIFFRLLQVSVINRLVRAGSSEFRPFQFLYHYELQSIFFKILSGCKYMYICVKCMLDSSLPWQQIFSKFVFRILEAKHVQHLPTIANYLVHVLRKNTRKTDKLHILEHFYFSSLLMIFYFSSR